MSDRPCGSHCACAPSDPELSRRSFLALVGLGAGSIMLAGCGNISGTDGGPPDSVSLTLRVDQYAELASVGGEVLVSDSGGNRLVVVRTGAATFLALSRVCPHAGGTISPYNSGFRCAAHQATFDATGHWVGGQPTSNMRSYPTAYDAATGTLVIG